MCFPSAVKPVNKMRIHKHVKNILSLSWEQHSWTVKTMTQGASVEDSLSQTELIISESKDWNYRPNSLLFGQALSQMLQNTSDSSAIPSCDWHQTKLVGGSQNVLLLSKLSNSLLFFVFCNFAWSKISALIARDSGWHGEGFAHSHALFAVNEERVVLDGQVMLQWWLGA